MTRSSNAAGLADSSIDAPSTARSRSRTSGAPRCRQSSRRSTKRREGKALQDPPRRLVGNANAHKDLYNNNGKGRYRYEVPRLSYEDIRKIMERRLTLQKRELLTEREIGNIVQDWEDGRREEEIDKRIIASEARRMEKKFKKYNVPMLGNMPREKDEGRCRFLYCQLNNASTKVVRDIKMDTVQRLNDRYEIDVDLFAEMGTNFTVGGASNNLGSWFEGREKKKFATAHNTHDPNKSTYQPGGTGVMIRGPMTQYARHGSQDPRKLGRCCSYVFWRTRHISSG